MNEIVLVNVTGPDRPGITAALTEVMGKYGIIVLDIGQAVIHHNLSWGMLVEVPAEAAVSPVFKELMFKAHELGLLMQLTPVSEGNYTDWVKKQGQARYVITVLAKALEAEALSRVSELIAVNHLNIDQIRRMSGRESLSVPLHRRRSAIEFHVRGPVPDHTVMHATFLQLSQRLNIDIAIQEDNVFRRNRRLVCFDMDSTLIQNEVIDELAKVAGVGPEVSAITERAMSGEIEFRDSFKQRLALLEGLPESKLAGIAEALTITDGAQTLINTLKYHKFKVAILSGGFTYFAKFLQKKLAIDYVYANELEIVDGKLTGQVIGDIVDESRKAELLRQIANDEDIHLEQVIAVGDGANDVPMLCIAGLGIAFRAKPIVKQQTRFALGSASLDSILFLIGMRERDFRTISSLPNSIYPQ
ncbi:MAG: phosphoserine phosphatase [Parasphingorhabdus sp.]|jgi:phosphoserine phosphatase